MASATKKPQLIVFDLDYTLWPFWVDTHVTPPFRKDKKGDVVDSTGEKIRFYPETPSVLEYLHREGYKMAVASRTGEIEGANQLLQLFNWNRYFQYKEIYPGCKVKHFNQFKKKSGIDLEDMLFFDDEHRNIRDLKAHGVVSILVQNGMTMKVVEEGLKVFSTERKN
ncbi:magnesium-dependent phosphatase 1 [Anabrus simplex]|uniref:magnesium-dependent phosphatase 1 n=1 Tax=Anabrus simplex TaxID=316456 RepID=UPI0034DDAED6